MDSNGNGFLSALEVEEAATEHFGEAVSQLVIANLMATADYDGANSQAPAPSLPFQKKHPIPYV
jgi:hypothetical protein